MSPVDRSTAPITILMADDDEEDRELTRDALDAAHLANPIRFVGDGQELMDYLHLDGAYKDFSALTSRQEIAQFEQHEFRGYHRQVGALDEG